MVRVGILDEASMSGVIKVGLKEPRAGRSCGSGGVDLSVEREACRSLLARDTDDVCIGLV